MEWWFFGTMALLCWLTARDVAREQAAKRRARELLARRSGGSPSPSA